jgi:aryl-alcohol dehydrogenase-like predicted oxidoreductase
VTCSIIGESNPSQIQENVKGLEMAQLLTDEVVEEIEAVLGNRPGAVPNWR